MTEAAVPRGFGLIPDEETRSLAERIGDLPPDRAARVLMGRSEEQAALTLTLLPAAETIPILWEMAPALRARIAAAAPEGKGAQWLIDAEYPAGTVGRLIEKPLAVFRPDTTIREATERLRELVKKARIHFGFVTDDDGILKGVFAFRELLFGSPDDPISSIMTPEPFSLSPDLKVIEAVRKILSLHVPAFPVTDATGRLLGMVRARILFQQEAFDVSSQAQRSHGVDSEERPNTPWTRSLKFRHPWLQLNLLTAFGVAAVVGLFQHVVEQVVVLALFIPVVAGQTANTAHQTLAVTLRGLTLGALSPGAYRRLFSKEVVLGTVNGFLTGVTAGLGMFVAAWIQKEPRAATLGAVVAVSLAGACALGGVCGAIIPLTLKKLGFDPVTASAIFVTTATDIVSMSCFLGLATFVLVR
jgi:magnesium transporter